MFEISLQKDIENLSRGFVTPMQLVKQGRFLGALSSAHVWRHTLHTSGTCLKTQEKILLKIFYTGKEVKDAINSLLLQTATFPRISTTDF